jgi:hypothetical protein
MGLIRDAVATTHRIPDAQHHARLDVGAPHIRAKIGQIRLSRISTFTDVQDKLGVAKIGQCSHEVEAGGINAGDLPLPPTDWNNLQKLPHSACYNVTSIF